MATINNLKSSRRENENWKVVVNPRVYDFNTEVWIIQRIGNESSILHFDSTGFGVTTIFKEGESPSPTFILPSSVWQMLVDAVTDTTPPSNQSKVEGNLQATKYHLEDLRTLLKLAKT